MPLATAWDGVHNGATVRELLAFLDELHAHRFRNGKSKRSSFEFLDARTSLHITASASQTTDPTSDEERVLIALLHEFHNLPRLCRGRRPTRALTPATAAAGRNGSATTTARGNASTTIAACDGMTAGRAGSRSNVPDAPQGGTNAANGPPSGAGCMPHPGGGGRRRIG